MTDDLEQVTLFRADVLAVAEMSAALDPDSPNVDDLGAELVELQPYIMSFGEAVGGPVRVGMQLTADPESARSFILPASVWQYLLIRHRPA